MMDYKKIVPDFSNNTLLKGVIFNRVFFVGVEFVRDMLVPILIRELIWRVILLILCLNKHTNIQAQKNPPKRVSKHIK